MMKKSPGIQLHTINIHTNPEPPSIITVQQYPMDQVGFKDFFNTRFTSTYLTISLYDPALVYSEYEYVNAYLTR